MRWMLYTGIAAVFLLGGAAGAMLGMTLERERLQQMESGPPAMLMEAVSRRLEHELNLDPEQTTKVRAVYAESRPDVIAVETERRQKMQAIMQAAHAKVEAVLRPEQVRTFADLQQRVEMRMRMRENGGPGGGGKGRGGWQGPPAPHEDRRPRFPGDPPGPPHGGPGGRHPREGKPWNDEKPEVPPEDQRTEQKNKDKKETNPENPSAEPENRSKGDRL